jgi:release factor glutamine methyltransferase
LNSIKQQLEWAKNVLYSISCSAALDSEVLLAHCLQKNRSYLITWPEKELTSQQLECFRDLVRRRLQPQPVAYLTGQREFYSMELNTTPATLVPRPETEMLVDKVLDIVADIESPGILELGTGTGAISLALKRHIPHSHITATDISADALKVAQFNAQQYHLEINWLQSDWYQSVPPETFDVIASNPPYIAEGDPYLSQGDLPAEPQQALCSGETGLEALEQIIQGVQKWLKPSGWIVLEHGYDQQEAVSQLLSKQGFSCIETLKDFNELPRLSIACYLL